MCLREKISLKKENLNKTPSRPLLTKPIARVYKRDSSSRGAILLLRPRCDTVQRRMLYSMLELPPRKRQPTNRYSPHGDDVTVGEVVTAAWLDGKMYDGKVAGLREDGTLAIDFDDGDKLGAVKRRSVLRSSNGASAAEKATSRRKSKVKPKGLHGKVPWQHHGFSRSMFCPKPEHESVAESLIFEYDASFKFHNQIGPRVTDTVSLHDIVNGDMPLSEKNMHTRALSDFMKVLLLRTPSADSMEELLESSGTDPMGPLNEKQRAERQEIYKQHELESDDMEDSEHDAEEARV